MRRELIRVPRLYVARENAELWSAPAACRWSCTEYERVERLARETPSALRFLLPDFCEDEAARIREIRENMYAALEGDRIEKLNRGLMFVERTTRSGVRRGVVAAFDLEYFDENEAVTSGMVPSKKMEPRIELRKVCPLEFPSVMVLYRDKKNKLNDALMRAELEEVYSYELASGSIRGSYIPDDWSEVVASDLPSRGDPCFVIVEGADEAYAAKRHWEALKKDLTEEQCAMHPARFLLAEFVNEYDDAVALQPIHRIVEGTDSAALADYMMKRVKCTREGNLVALKNAEQAPEAEQALREFLRQDGGELTLTRSKKKARTAVEQGAAAVLLCAPEKEDLFRLKGGPYPADAFGVAEPRATLEGREISYD